MRRGLYQKRFGGNNFISTAAINIGSTKGRGSSTRRFIYCKQQTNDFTSCLESIINVRNTPQILQLNEFVYSFEFVLQPTIETITPYLPIINDDNSFTNINVSISIIQNTSTAIITLQYLFDEVNPLGDDGLSFNAVSAYYNNTTSNLTIIDFGGIPLSRNTSGNTGQFEGLLNIVWTTITSPPTILLNTKLDKAFYQLASFDSNVNNWNTENVISMISTFSGCTNFNNGGSPLTWNTSFVSNMQYMFYACENFNQPLNTFNTNNVTNMYGMFSGCQNFNQNISFDISNNYWSTALVNTMGYMFFNAYNFNNGQGSGENSQPMNWVVIQIEGDVNNYVLFGENSNLTTSSTTSNNAMFTNWTP